MMEQPTKERASRQCVSLVRRTAPSHVCALRIRTLFQKLAFTYIGRRSKSSVRALAHIKLTQMIAATMELSVSPLVWVT